MSKKTKQKNLVIEEDLINQIETLCDILHTNFATKAKELLVEWKIKELKRLKEDAPEMYQEYNDRLKK